MYLAPYELIITYPYCVRVLPWLKFLGTVVHYSALFKTKLIFLLIDYTYPGLLPSWESWSKCSVTCGGGQQTRIRKCYILNRYCMEKSLQTRQCNIDPCLGKYYIVIKKRN